MKCVHLGTYRSKLLGPCGLMARALDMTIAIYKVG